MCVCRCSAYAELQVAFQSFPPRREGESGSRWSLRHTVEESQGQPMKRQVLWPLQWAQHMAAMVIWVVLVAGMALVT